MLLRRAEPALVDDVNDIRIVSDDVSLTLSRERFDLEKATVKAKIPSLPGHADVAKVDVFQDASQLRSR